MITFYCILGATIGAGEWLSLSMICEHIAHAQGSKSICKSVYACSRVGRSMSVRPDDVEAGIDVRNGKVVEGGMSQGQSRQIIRMSYL